MKQFKSKDELVLKLNLGINNFPLKPHTVACEVSIGSSVFMWAKGRCKYPHVFLIGKGWNNYAFNSDQLTVLDLT